MNEFCTSVAIMERGRMVVAAGSTRSMPRIMGESFLAVDVLGDLELFFGIMASDELAGPIEWNGGTLQFRYRGGAEEACAASCPAGRLGSAGRVVREAEGEPRGAVSQGGSEGAFVMSHRLAGKLARQPDLRQARSIAAPQAAASLALVITVVLCLCIVWGGFQLDAFRNGGTFGILFGLQAILLGIMGTAQVASAVSSARASGILDFHRVSPLSSAELVLGFFFGAPVREYLLLACTLPFAFLCLAMGSLNFRELLQLVIILISTSWVLHGLSLLNALTLKKQAGARGVVGLAIFFGFMTSGLFRGFGNILSHLDQDPRLEFFGISLPWLIVVLLYQIPILFFTFLAARRKMNSERLHPLSKPQALAALGTLGVLVLGGIWTVDDMRWLATVVIYLLATLGMILTVMVTPTQAEYYKGLWRCQTRPGPDSALGRSGAQPALPRDGLRIVLVTATTAWQRLAEGSNLASTSPHSSFPLAIANGVLVVAYFGLAHQFFLLRFGRRGPNYLGLFLFLTWVVPLLVGTIMVFSSTEAGPGQVAFAVSPIAGIGLATGMSGEASASLMAVQAAAITPSLLFTFVYSGLVSSAKRRVCAGRSHRNRKDERSRRA